MESKNKLEVVKTAIADICKQFGRGAIQALGGDGGAAEESMGVISTGSLRLDQAMGIGGMGRGRIIEVFGHESSGKTTLALSALASAQRAGGVVAFIDAEHALDPNWAKTLGVDIDQLLVSQPDCGEQALEITETLVRSGAIDLVVVDSVAALTPRAEIEGEMGDTHVGLQARLMSQAMRKLTAHASRTKSAILFINQIRHKIGVAYGSPETTTGGNALKFYASMRVEVRRIGSVKNGDEVVGSRVRARVVKNKLAPPFRDAELEVLYGRGLSRAAELLDLSVEAQLVDKSGAWYSVCGVRMGQGRDRARDWLEARPSVMEGLQDILMSGASAEALSSAMASLPKTNEATPSAA